MIRFESDYLEGCHPAILARLAETNFQQTVGYGQDEYCLSAAEKIRAACHAPEADVHFLVGGTQANMTIIASALRPHEGVLCAESGHINVHETGAVEATGHKVLGLASADGKITAAQVEAAWQAHVSDHSFEHTVKPGMVYISHPTENGTLYSKAELEELSRVCRRLGLPLFLDGARLGYGLAASCAELTLPDIARLCDVFYIGGTKVGALFGEAVVITGAALKPDFRYFIKQRGGMLAKGRLLGIQFDVLFEDGLYEQISRHAAELSERLADALKARGVEFLYKPQSNQLFPILPDSALAALEEQGFSYNFTKKVSASDSAVRFCTSWATADGDVDRLIACLDGLLA